MLDSYGCRLSARVQGVAAPGYAHCRSFDPTGAGVRRAFLYFFFTFRLACDRIITLGVSLLLVYR